MSQASFSLSDLVKIGSIKQDWVKRKVTWKNGEEETAFDILVKQEMSAADNEFIYLGTSLKRDSEGNVIEGTDDSFAARRVHRMARMADNEAIPYETAKGFKSSLLAAMCVAINEAEKKPDVAEAKKKPATTKKSSGTNSSSTESAEEQ